MLQEAWRRLTHDPVEEARQEMHMSTVRLRMATDALTERTRQITADDTRTTAALERLADMARRQ